MATSEIFPIFQRTKRPARPASRPVQRSTVNRSAETQARPTIGTGAPRVARAARNPQRAGDPVHASRAVRAGDAGRVGDTVKRVRVASDRGNATMLPRPNQRVAIPNERGSARSERLAPRTTSTSPSARTALGTRQRTRATQERRDLVVPPPVPQKSRHAAPTRVEQGDRPARRFLMRVAIALLLLAIGVFALAFLGVLPARTYFGQQDELVQKKARLVMLGERNSVLGNRVASLQSDQVVARIARDQFGMVAPGDTLTVLPGLRDESLSLNGDASNVVTAVPQPT